MCVCGVCAKEGAEEKLKLDWDLWEVIFSLHHY